MAFPVATSYSVGSGLPIYGGRAAPSGVEESPPVDGTLPLWAQNAPLNAWMEIAGTSGAGGAAADDFSGWAVTDSGVIVIAAAGGHGGSTDNRVVSLDLMANTPAWVQRCAPSATVTYDTAYNPDGKPASRHTYHSTLWVSGLNRVMLFGVYGTAGNATSFTNVDGFNLDTDTWDAAGTWPNDVGAIYGVFLDFNGNVWDNGGSHKGTVSGGNLSWAPQTLNPAVSPSIRHPWARDTLRQQVYGLSFGDGQGFGAPAMRSLIQAGTAQTAITFDAGSSAAVSQFASEAPAYAAMTYDPNGDCFYFYAGTGSAAGRVYKIVPNNTTEWHMEIASFAGGTAPTAAPGTGSGINGKFTYVPALKGIVAMPKRGDSLQFLRTL